MRTQLMQPARKLAALALAASVLAGCAATSGGAKEQSSTVDSAAGVTHAREQLAQFRNVPTFTPPGPQIDSSRLRGMSMFVIPLMGNEVNKAANTEMQKVADELGIDLTIYQNQGQVSQWAQGMNIAVSSDPDVIVLSGAPDPRMLQPQIAAAAKAGIPVVVTNFYDDASPAAPDCDGCSNITAITTQPMALSVRLQADWVIADSGGSANVLYLTASDVQPTVAMTPAIQDEIKTYCGHCSLKMIELPIAGFSGDTLQKEVRSALIADPSISYVVAQLDQVVPDVVAAVRTVGRDDLTIVANSGSPFGLSMVRDGTLAANAGFSLPWAAYAGLDQAFRVMLHEKVVTESVPLRFFDKSNVDDAGNPPVLELGYGTDYVTGYRRLWGLK